MNYEERRKAIAQALEQLGPDGKDLWQQYESVEKNITDQRDDLKKQLEEDVSAATGSLKKNRIIGVLATLTVTAIGVVSSILFKNQSRPKRISMGVAGAAGGGLIGLALQRMYWIKNRMRRTYSAIITSI